MCTQRNNNEKTKEEEGDKVTTVSIWIHTVNAKNEMRLKRKKEEKAFKEKKKSHHLNMMIKQELFVI